MTGRRRDPLPPPDLSGTDPDRTLRSRIDLNVPVNPPSTPAQTSPIHAHTQVRTGKGRVGASKGGTRSDPAGMRRTSIYISVDAAEALERAADRIMEILGDGTPRHVALSALLIAGAERVDVVVQELARQRAEELAARLAALPPVPE